jgi:hypothetical protein
MGNDLWHKYYMKFTPTTDQVGGQADRTWSVVGVDLCHLHKNSCHVAVLEGNSLDFFCANKVNAIQAWNLSKHQTIAFGILQSDSTNAWNKIS